jgi:hypothetical protein
MTVKMRHVLLGALVIALASSWGTWALRDVLSAQENSGNSMPKGKNVPVVSMYSGPDGQSHFRDIEVPLSRAINLGGAAKDPKSPGAASELVKNPDAQFRTTPNTKEFNEWHPENKAQYMVIIRGALELEASDGEKRILRPGDILLAEDRTGKGHHSRGVGDVDRIQLFIPIEGGASH